MKELVIASNNKGKINEIRSLINDINLLSLADINYTQEIPEPFDSFDENAFTKAQTIFEFCGKNVFADDSGLCVSALNNAPGAISAHYSGERNDEKNVDVVLQKLQGSEDRSAHYIAVICLIWDEETYFFEGICNGKIADARQGSGGFGYDPIFIPEGYDKTFGELPAEIKNEISHRGKAVRKMVAFIKEHQK